MPFDTTWMYHGGHYVKCSKSKQKTPKNNNNKKKKEKHQTKTETQAHREHTAGCKKWGGWVGGWVREMGELTVCHLF